MRTGSCCLRVVLVSVAVVSACKGEAVAPEVACMIVPLPLTGDAAGPTVTDVGLEVQQGGIVVVATATDPDGTENLLHVIQSVAVFRNDRCEGSPIVLEDDLAGSDLEETFGTAVDAVGDPDLYAAIAGSEKWPVEVEFRDLDDHLTSGRVYARIER